MLIEEATTNHIWCLDYGLSLSHLLVWLVFVQPLQHVIAMAPKAKETSAAPLVVSRMLLVVSSEYDWSRSMSRMTRDTGRAPNRSWNRGPQFADDMWSVCSKQIGETLLNSFCMFCCFSFGLSAAAHYSQANQLNCKPVRTLADAYLHIYNIIYIHSVCSLKA